ncbi:MAG: nitroreductase family protein, partial [Pseudobutyrivibrio sp.]|nr:nitroreductase family protein [Pseudobutyrivibrio sp.]
MLPEILNRRSIRKYKSIEVTNKQIGDLILAASLAPSGSNEQPW